MLPAVPHPRRALAPPEAQTGDALRAWIQAEARRVDCNAPPPLPTVLVGPNDTGPADVRRWAATAQSCLLHDGSATRKGAQKGHQ